MAIQLATMAVQLAAAGRTGPSTAQRTPRRDVARRTSAAPAQRDRTRGVRGLRRSIAIDHERHMICTLGSMPRGSKSKYTSKQKRQAHRIEENAKKRGYSS